MKELILKDFRLLKYSNIIILVICLTGGYVGSTLDNIIISRLVYILVALMSSYLSSLLLGQRELKTKTDIIINSLPINRSLVVKSKYIFTVLYALVTSSIVYISSHISGYIFRDTSGVKMSPIDILAIIALILIFYSIYLFLYYFNFRRAQLFNQISYVLIILAPSLFERIGENIFKTRLFSYILNLNFNTVIILLIFLSIVFYMVSLGASIKVFKTKDI